MHLRSRSSSLAAAGSKVGAAVLGLGVSALIARQMGAAETGIYFFSLNLVMLSAVGGRLGSDLLVVKEVARRDDGPARPLRRFVFNSFLAVLIPSVLIAVLFRAALPSLSALAGFKEGMDNALELLIWSLIPTNLVTWSASVLRGQARFVIAEPLGLLLLPGLMLGLLWSIDLISASGVARLYLGVATVAAVLALVAVVFSLPRADHGGETGLPAIGFLAFWWAAPPFLGMMLTTTLLQSYNSVALGLVSTEEAVGTYHVAFRASAVLLIVPAVVNTVAAPHLTRLLRDAKPLETRRTAVSALLLTTILLIVPPALLGWAFSDSVLAFFGPEFVTARAVFRMLLIGQVVACLGLVAVNFCHLAGTTRRTLGLEAICLILLIGGGTILMASHGALGAAIAYFGLVILRSAVYLAWATAHLGGRLSFNRSVWKMALSIIVGRPLS